VELLGGLLYIHSRLNANTSETLEAMSALSRLIELLIRKGLVTAEEVDESRRSAGRTMAAQFEQNRPGVFLNPLHEDKYALSDGIAIDCENRVQFCRAACCRLKFPLTKQDVQEGIVRWDLERPYMIAHDERGACSHLDPAARCCTVWEKRPAICRVYDCRQDKRIWVDFDKKIPNPDMDRPDWPHCNHVEQPGVDIGSMETVHDQSRSDSTTG